MSDTTTDDTKAGNYFVANYPPFSFWGEQDVPCVDSLLNSPAPQDIPLGLYLHIPFCRKRCHFCYFRVYTDKNSSDIRRYLAATMNELRQYADIYDRDAPVLAALDAPRQRERARETSEEAVEIIDDLQTS